jgi:hypothetical protein
MPTAGPCAVIVTITMGEFSSTLGACLFLQFYLGTGFTLETGALLVATFSEFARHWRWGLTLDINRTQPLQSTPTYTASSASNMRRTTIAVRATQSPFILARANQSASQNSGIPSG